MRPESRGLRLASTRVRGVVAQLTVLGGDFPAEWRKREARSDIPWRVLLVLFRAVTMAWPALCPSGDGVGYSAWRPLALHPGEAWLPRCAPFVDNDMPGGVACKRFRQNSRGILAHRRHARAGMYSARGRSGNDDAAVYGLQRDYASRRGVHAAGNSGVSFADHVTSPARLYSAPPRPSLGAGPDGRPAYRAIPMRVGDAPTVGLGFLVQPSVPC